MADHAVADGAAGGPTIVFVLGGPGSGKGTQCGKLVEEFDIDHFSAGDLLRAHVQSGSPEGKMVHEIIQQGQIVPSHITVGLLQKAISESSRHQFLIDGFPRNEENRQAFVKITGWDCRFVLFFDTPEEVMERRLLARKEGRSDDNIETIKKRFQTFINSTMPIIEHYQALDKVRSVNGDQGPADVYEVVRQHFSDFSKKPTDA
eukprot:evm.model.scf_2381.1 EVM.evm.TU.scf_2381.1   scf_2381:5287-7579(-)